MLILEEKELEKTIEFLNILKCDLNSIDYIEKNKIFYDSKTFEPINDLLTFILQKYDHPSNIHLYCNRTTKNIQFDIKGFEKTINVPFLISSKDNYTTAQIRNNPIVYSTEYFKDIIEKLTDIKAQKDPYGFDFVYNITIPVFGNYRLRMSSRDHDGVIRLIKSNTENSYNLVSIKDTNNLVYTIEIELNDRQVEHNSRITLPFEVIKKINLYEESLSKMFNSIEQNVEEKTPLNFWKSNKMKIFLEYTNNNEINVNITKNYLIEQPFMETSILQYLYKNYQDFYDPVFKNFIEDVTQIKIDPTIGEFKTPEDLKRYLILLDMIKI